MKTVEQAWHDHGMDENMPAHDFFVAGWNAAMQANASAAQMTWLGEVAAKAALRANQNGDRAGGDQNRGQFVAMVTDALNSMPVDLRGDYVQHFLTRYANGAFGSTSAEPL